MANLVTVKNLSIQFGKQFALKNIDLRIGNGDFVVLAGPNGSGKSTLVKAVLGILPVSDGSIQVHTKNIGYLPQNTVIQERFFPATVKEVIETGFRNRKMLFGTLSENEKEELDKVTQLLGIESFLRKRIGLLSGGQQQRVLLARALVSKPDLLILDEPTSALDTSIRDQFYRLISDINKLHNTSVLLISHDIVSSCEYANRIVYLDESIQFDGPFDEFCELSELTPYIHQHELKHHEGGVHS